MLYAKAFSFIWLPMMIAISIMDSLFATRLTRPCHAFTTVTIKEFLFDNDFFL